MHGRLREHAARRRTLGVLLAWLPALAAATLLAACGGSGAGRTTTNSSAPAAPASYTLTVSVSGNGSVTSNPSGINCGSSCAASYASDTQVTLTATPSSGNSFSGWGGACSGSSSTCTVAMSQAQNVSASFVANVTLSVTVSGNGSVSSNPSGISCGGTCSASYASGTAVTLTATPSSGATFSGWGGACAGTSTTCTLTLSQTQSVSASFGGGQITINTHLFAPTSFWYQPIPTNVTLNANSAAYAQDLAKQVVTYYGNASINTDSYAAPVYYVQTSGAPYTTSSDPNAAPLFQVSGTVNVKAINCSGGTWVDPNLVAQWQNVPIPPGATPSQGTDSEFDVYDISTQTYWEFWASSQVNGQWQACWGGRIQNAGQSNGIFPNSYGGSATGLPYQPGEITPDELAAGKIDHVMGIAIVNTAAWNVFSWPANRSDGNGAGIIPEGIRMRLDPSVNVDALNLTPVGRTIAIAAQKYGFVLWDKAGSVSLRASNPASYTLAGKADPYPALYGGLAYWQVLQNFPWNKMQFLPMNYGQPAQ